MHHSSYYSLSSYILDLKSLAEEGAAIVAFKLVVGGVFQEAGISQLLTEGGTRCLGGDSASYSLIMLL